MARRARRLMADGISVVVPCFNARGHLAAALGSILAQTRLPDEILLIDDGSTDGSGEQAARLASGTSLPIRILRQANQGVAAARNAGVASAKGSLIAFLDADDRWPPESLAVRTTAIGTSNAEIVFGRVRILRERDGCLVPAGPQGPGRLAGSMLVRRALFDRLGGFDPGLRSAETIAWVARANEAGVPMASVDEVVLHRMVHGENMMLQAGGQGADRFAVLRAAASRRRRDALLA